MHEQRKRSTSAVQAISAASEAARLAASIRLKSAQNITFMSANKKSGAVAAVAEAENFASVREEEKNDARKYIDIMSDDNSENTQKTFNASFLSILIFCARLPS